MVAELTWAAEGAGHGGGMDRVPTQRRIGTLPGDDACRGGIVTDEVGQSIDYAGKR